MLDKIRDQERKLFYGESYEVAKAQNKRDSIVPYDNNYCL
ncbi:hypothetical protein BWGOE13_55340 [Bacillus mycoides]|uniref:Uncharacterized protein n=1 Tax=Bacillus mycoides TaxID=1405 RepID=A0A1E8BLH6_BACMY|nr:hypothetical protein BWGOE11_34310 [Bacillus mycoides]OFD91334.1 hypothetical protein BWGOE13_55340 [Bacillus mycoides]